MVELCSPHCTLKQLHDRGLTLFFCFEIDRLLPLPIWMFWQLDWWKFYLSLYFPLANCRGSLLYLYFCWSFCMCWIFHPTNIPYCSCLLPWSWRFCPRDGFEAHCLRFFWENYHSMSKKCKFMHSAILFEACSVNPRASPRYSPHRWCFLAHLCQPKR